MHAVFSPSLCQQSYSATTCTLAVPWLCYGTVRDEYPHTITVSTHPQVSATLLGEPDLGLLTPPEMARKAGQIVYSIPGIPVLVDADTGGVTDACRQ